MSPDPYIPPPTKETFIAVNVREDATREEIVRAIDEALKTIDNPYFQYATPQYMNCLRAGSGKDLPPINSGKGLQIMVRHEGP